MKFGDKEFQEYWKIIKTPTYILIAWSILSFVIGMISFSLYLTIFSPITGWILVIAVFSFIGWTVIKDHKLTIKFAAWSGALAGAISGIVVAVIRILMFHLVPQVIEAAIAQAAQAGLDASAMQSFMAIGVYTGLIIAPLISGIIGAIIASLGALVATKVK